MGLEILAGMVVIGIVAVVAFVHWSGGSRAVVFENPEAAIRAFLADYPEARVEDVRLTQRGDAAFFKQADSDRLGFVQAFGHHHMTRDISPFDLSAPAQLDHAAVTIKVRDFTWKAGRFVFANTSDAADVVRWCPKPASGPARYALVEVRHG